MKHILHVTGTFAALALGACSTTTPTAPVSVPSVGSVAMDATTGGYSVTVNGTTTDMGIRTALTTGGLIWNSATSTTLAYAFTNTDVMAAGGFIKATTTPFAGVTGTLGPAPTGPTATYSGRIGLVAVNPANGALAYNNTPLNMSANFSNNTISQDYLGVTINGTISGSAFTGTVGYAGLTAPMAGGFYGTNTAAGAFSGPSLAGAFLGTKP